MKARVLRTVVGLAAVLSGLLVASPAQALDGPDSAQVYFPGFSGSGGYVRADIDFLSPTEVLFRNFSVRDVCPEDGRPVRGRAVATDASGLGTNFGPFVADTNGCGPTGTTPRTFKVTYPRGVAKASLQVCVYTDSTGNLRCVTSVGRDNPYL